MTPKEKAKELVDKYCNMESHCDDAKECALIAVDEMINILSMPNIPKYYPIVNDEYWQEVKTEIENL
jgi:hypothetical protein